MINNSSFIIIIALTVFDKKNIFIVIANINDKKLLFADISDILKFVKKV